MENNTSVKPSLFSGAGIGLLFGVIMGTSVEPIVATMFGALTTILAAILGLNDKYFNNAKALRIGAFGFACVIGANAGIFVRSHNLLSPSLADLKHEYLAVGYTEKQALNFITQKEFGVTLVSYQQNVENENRQEYSAAESGAVEAAGKLDVAMVNPLLVKQHSSLLFSAPVELGGCDELEHTDASLPLDEIINNFILTGGVWEILGLQVSERVGEERQQSILLTIKDAACQVNKVDQESCSAIGPYLLKKNYQMAFDFIVDRDDGWEKVVTVIDASALSVEEKWLSLTWARETLCGFK